MAKFAVTFIGLLLGIHFALFAQREIKGHAYDKDNRKPLAEANIFLFTAEKSILKGQTVSDKYGNFTIKNVPPGNFVLTISFMGYRAATIPMEFTNKPKSFQIPLLQTGLLRNTINLNSISIKINKPVFVIRKDTIEFSASDFPIAENVSMKNLLQKIPGLTVDIDGNFFYLGKPIKELYINGRPVFQDKPNSSGDPQKISQLLLANLVDKIQIADKKGMDGMIEGNKNEKVINITVKKEMKKGINGTVGAGYGTDERYNVAANANMFRDDKQIIATGNINNVNSSGGPSSTDENLNRMNSFGGLMDRKSLDGNISMDISKKTKLNANLGHFGSQSIMDMQVQRDNILADSNFRYNNHTQSNANQALYNLYTNLTIQPDNKNFISFDLSGSHENLHFTSQNNYLSLGGKRNDTINTGNTVNIQNKKTNGFTANTRYTHVLSKKAGSVNLSFSIDQNNTRDDQHNNTLNLQSTAHLSDTINQQITSTLNIRKIVTGISYQYPLKPGFSLSAGYRFNTQRTTNNQQALDFDHIKNGFSIINNDLTYNFQNNYNIQTLSAGIFINQNKLQGALNISYNSTSSISDNNTLGKEYRQKINYIAPTVFLSYKIDNYKTLSANLSRETRMPNNGEMLVPVVSTSNPLYVQLGNPDLKPTINNGGSLGYRSFSVNGLSFSSNLGFDFPQHATTLSVYSDSVGKQITQPVNVSGNYSFNQDLSLGKRFTKSGVSINYNLRYNLFHGNTFVNKLKNVTSNFVLSQMMTGSWTYKKLMELEGMASMIYNSNTYSIQNNANYDYLNYNVSMSVNAYLPMNINVGVAAVYTNLTSQHQQYVVLNSWISKTFLPDKSLQVKLYVYDLLRENRAVMTYQSLTFIEQQTNNILTQYYLFSVSYFFGKKGHETAHP